MILVNDPGAVEDTYPALLHAPWTGWTFALHVLGVFLVVWFMYRRRWFLRI